VLDKATALREILRILDNMHTGESLQLLTWKGDRSLLLQKMATEDILVTESGYVNETQLVPLTKIRKVVKKLLKREFPRSHKIRTKIIQQP
jgi:hypothetical protein